MGQFLLQDHEFVEQAMQCKLLGVTPLTGDASLRQYFRVELESQQSYVVCKDPFFQQFPGVATAYDFIAIGSLLGQQRVRVPQILAFDQQLGLLLEEDLGCCSFLQSLAARDAADERHCYQRLIDQMLVWQKLPRATIAAATSVASRAFDLAKYQFEFNFTQEHFWQNYLQVSQLLAQEMTLALLPLIESLDRMEKNCFVHRDYHSRNVMVRPTDGALVVIDFQDARMGPALYDLVSLLDDCYYQIAPENKSWLINYAFTQMVEASLLPSPLHQKAAFDHAYAAMAIQRLYKAIGSFAYLWGERKNPRYLQYISRAMERIRTLLSETSPAQCDGAKIKKLLFESYYAS